MGVGGSFASQVCGASMQIGGRVKGAMAAYSRIWSNYVFPMQVESTNSVVVPRRNLEFSEICAW